MGHRTPKKGGTTVVTEGLLSLQRPLRLLVLMAALGAPWQAGAAPPHGGLIEPRMTILADGAGPTVALTFDACGGRTDHRILDMLVSQRIPATIFVTGLWLRHNASSLALMLAHPDLFEIENHGARHVPAVDRHAVIYGIPAAGSPDAVRLEVSGGAAAIRTAAGVTTHLFRGATAEYTASSMALIRSMGFGIAGFSIAADGGGLLGVAATARKFEAARNGDVLLAHINKPGNPAGLGVVKGVLALKARGYRFVRLADVRTVLDSGRNHDHGGGQTSGGPSRIAH